MGYTEVFWITLSSLSCGGVALLIKVLYKVKCSEIRCCGCIAIKRDIEEEMKLDNIEAAQNAANNRRSSLSLGFSKV